MLLFMHVKRIFGCVAVHAAAERAVNGAEEGQRFRGGAKAGAGQEAVHGRAGRGGNLARVRLGR